MQPKAITFNREGRNIIGTVYNYILEPSAGGRYKHQLIYFVKDSDGKRYRVPKVDVITMGKLKTKKSKKSKKKKTAQRR